MSAERLMRWLNRVTRTTAITSTAIGATGGAHLLLLLGAALRGRRRGSPSANDSMKVAVVMPAHDEEEQIASAIASVQASDYSPANLRIVVVADNCTDQTAAAASAAGAEVWERFDPDHRGKGFALAWACERLLADDWCEAVAVIDADCEISPNLLGALAARLRAGADAAQAAYLVSNPEASPGVALRWAGFALFNVVRPLGRQELGLSSGLLGTGMAISRELLISSPWKAFSYAEDREQHMRWVLRGARVAFVREAAVRSRSPSTDAGSRAQEARWDSGRLGLVTDLTPRLLARWLRTGELAAFDAALEPLLPPQSLLLAANVVAVATSRLAGRRVVRRVATASFMAQCVYVFGGLASLDAPASVWWALLSVPRFVQRRITVLGGSLAGRGPSGWQRTPRQSEVPRRRA